MSEVILASEDISLINLEDGAPGEDGISITQTIDQWGIGTENEMPIEGLYEMPSLVSSNDRLWHRLEITDSNGVKSYTNWIKATAINDLVVFRNSVTKENDYTAIDGSKITLMGPIDGNHMILDEEGIYLYDNSKSNSEFTNNRIKLGNIIIDKGITGDGTDAIYSDFKSKKNIIYRTWIRSATRDDTKNTWAFSVQQDTTGNGDSFVGKWYVTADGDMHVTGGSTFNNSVNFNKAARFYGQVQFGANAFFFEETDISIPPVPISTYNKKSGAAAKRKSLTTDSVFSCKKKGYRPISVMSVNVNSMFTLTNWYVVGVGSGICKLHITGQKRTYSKSADKAKRTGHIKVAILWVRDTK